MTKPIVEEERKTREILAKKMDLMGERLESIHITVSRIEQEIMVKKVAYGELEIIFPIALGVYKIHIPSGEITAQDLIKIKTEISRILTQVMEKAKQTSTKLYNELKNRKQEIEQEILTKLKKLQTQKRV